MEGIPFLHKNSFKITFFTSGSVISKSSYKIIKELQTFTNIYKARGLNIDVYHVYNGFNINYLRGHIRPGSLNIYAKVQHIPIIEIFIQTTNKVVRCTNPSLLFKSYTRLVMR